ncbi:MAG: hypothetical protein QM727_11185 [Niabella sp.]
MKFIRLFIISIAVFFLLATLVGFFIPSTIRISRATNIAPNKTDILDNISDLSKWPTWYPGLTHVPLEKSIQKDGKTVQATVQNVTLSITNNTDTTVLAQLQRSDRPVLMSWQLIHHGNNDSLTLQSYMDFKLKWYPWEKFSSLLLDKSYGTMMEQALQKLKDN